MWAAPSSDLVFLGASTDRSAASRFVSRPTFHRIAALDCDVAIVHRAREDNAYVADGPRSSVSVILEFTVDGPAFGLDEVLSEPPGVQLELERVVPIRADVAPYLWATGDDFETFEEHVRRDPRVEELRALDRVGDRCLYRIQWATEPPVLVEAIEETDATVLEARGDGGWLFRLRFDDHGALSRFYEFCTERDLSIHVERTYAPTNAAETENHPGLSEEQREALVLALERGYFATPSEASLDELATEIGITRQALSNRIRRGNETILRRALRPSTDGNRRTH